MKVLEHSVIDIKCEIKQGTMTIQRARVIETYDVSDFIKEFVEHKLQIKLIELDQDVDQTRTKLIDKIKHKIGPYCSRTFLVPKMIEIASGQVFQVGFTAALKWI